jgi:Predicted oxidoreductase related to nitroreductase
VNGSFLAGYGTVLFFEDMSVVKGLQGNMPSYSEKFAQWSGAFYRYKPNTGLDGVGE